MPGPVPKRAGLRQRRNRSATSALLPSEEASADRPVPPLPKREKRSERWHPKVVAWWRSVWKSPMADEYLGPDIQGGLLLLAELYQARWNANDIETTLAVAREIRLHEPRFGLTPIDRRRLQWEIEKAELAEDRTETRRKAKRLTESAKKDPREVMKVMS